MGFGDRGLLARCCHALDALAQIARDASPPGMWSPWLDVPQGRRVGNSPDGCLRKNAIHVMKHTMPPPGCFAPKPSLANRLSISHAGAQRPMGLTEVASAD
jgi:hypothetical protein